MSKRTPNPETILEFGLVAALLGLLAGVALLLGGWVTGGVLHGVRHRQQPPDPGEIPESRHQHTGSVSAR
jgi:hypothetical protein